MIATGVAVVRIDHGVVPSNDLGRTLAFFTNVLDAQFNVLINVNLRGLNREVPEMAFCTLATHRGFGIALQDQPIPAPVRWTDGPVWGFEIDARGIDGVLAALQAKGVAWEG